MRRVLLALLVVVTGCTLVSGPRSSGDHPLRVSAAGACPGTLGNHDGVRNSGSGLGAHLVPGSPTALLICRYSPKMGAQQPAELHGVLYGSRKLGARDAVEFARLLNAIPADQGERSCGPDSERYDVLAFAIAGRADVDVWSSSTGCWSFTNGARLTGAPGPALESYLLRLQATVAGETDVRAAADGERGTIQGRLLEDGMSSRPIVGKVTVAPGNVQPIVVGADGVFAVSLAPGTYTLTGLSPVYNRGRTRCRANGPVHIVAGQTVVANVYCLEK